MSDRAQAAVRGAWLAALLVSLLASWPVVAAEPGTAASPADCRWIEFGGPTGIAGTQGLTLRDKTGEGDLRAAELGGVACAQSIRADGRPGYFYLVAEPWEQLRTWLGSDSDVELALRYFDGGRGRLVISYDSSDPRVKLDPYPPGVWRRPDAYPDGVELTGDKSWKSLRTRLELAAFTKRVHAADLRLDGNAVDFALARVAIGRVPKADAGGLTVRQELRVAKAAGLTSFGRGARFAGRFEAPADGPLAMEAELATECSLEGDRTPGLDPKASNGAYLHYVDSATWRFSLPSPGTYVVWERAFFPWAGSWNHDEAFDGGPALTVYDGTRGPAEGWQWLRAQAVALAAGEHALTLAYHGGARLDLVVLSRHDQVPDLGALPVAYRGALEGELWTAPVRPFDVAGWQSVQFEMAGDLVVRGERSRDGGQTWEPLPPGGDLGQVPVHGNGEDSISFHLLLRAASGKPPGLFGGGSLTYRPGRNNAKTLENARVRLEVDPYGIQALADKRAAARVSRASQVHDALVSLTVKKPGPAVTTSVDLYNGSLEAVETGGTADEPTLELRHLLSNGMRLNTSARLCSNGQIEWQLRIDNPTDLEVAELRFPMLTGIRLGDEPRDDWIFLGKCWGQVWQNPGASGRLATEWGPCLRWTGLWDQRQGLYLGIEDERLDDYGFVYGGDSAGGTTLGACQRVLVKPRSTWASGTFRLALTGGDWHQGADLYRAYVSRTLRPTDVPPYVKWLVDAWCTQDSNAMNLVGFDVIRPGGELLMAANRQMLDGCDSGYCGMYPFPSPAWGTSREFAQKLAVRRALGGFYIPYHNTRLWSPGYGHYPRLGTTARARLPRDVPVPDDAWYAKVATYSYDGSYARLEADRFAQLGTAMAAGEWRDWLAYWTAQYLAWGADGMYYDQLNMIYPNGKLYPGFETYGCWVPASLTALDCIRTASRQHNPSYTAAGEFCNDLYGQHVDLHMTSGVMNRLEFFRYSAPDQLLIDGGWNGGLAPAYGGQERCRFIWQVGARFEQPPADHRLLALRRAVKSLLYDARFEDTVGIEVRDLAGQAIEPEYSTSHAQNAPVRGLSARWFLCRHEGQRGALLNLINAPVRQDARVSLDTGAFGPVRAAWVWNADGALARVAGRQAGPRYELDVPAAEVATVLLVNRVAPVVEWELDPVATAGNAKTFRLKITNVNPDPVSGTAALRLPPGWSTPAAVEFGPVPSGASAEVSIPFAVPAEVVPGATGPERHDVWCDVRTPTGAFAAYGFLVINAPVIADFRGSPGSYHLWFRNLTPQPLPGNATVRGPPPLTVACPAEFTVPAGAETAVPVTISGQDRLPEIAEIEASVTVGAQTLRLVRAVIPAVPNGGFEIDSAGDRKPDWWMCRVVRDEWGYERLHLAEGAAAGRYCLELDPPRAGEQFTCAYAVHSVFQPRTRYRASVWIRAASRDGVYARIAGHELGRGQTTSEWRQFSAEFTTGAELSGLYRDLFNHSPAPAYFDGLEVEQLGP